MSCLISFVWSSPGCEQRSVSENFKMIMYASAGNRTRDLLLSSVSLQPLGYRERYRHVVRTFTVLFDQTILQELCIVCKGYIENKNERTLLTYSFVIDTI